MKLFTYHLLLQRDHQAIFNFIHLTLLKKKKATSGLDVRAALAVVINRDLDSVEKCQGDFYCVSRKKAKPFS